jgi:hypothetical protein
MKRILAGCLLFIVPYVARCQWTTDTLLNTVVSDDAGIDETVPLSADGSGGTTYVSYFKSVGGNYQLHMQLLDSLGNALWGTGLVVSSFPQNSALFRYDLKSDHNGDAIVAFQDERLGHLSVVAYKIDVNGNFAWGPNGVQLGDSLATQDLAPVIGITSGNNAVVAWNANDGTNKWIAFSKISSTGSLMWSATHRYIDSSFVKKFSRPALAALDNERFLMMVVQETGSFPYTSIQYLQKFDPNGDAVAPSPGQVSTKAIGFAHFPRMVARGTAGVFIGFDSSNPLVPSLNDTYVQYMDTNLNAAWTATGLEMATNATDHRNIASLHYLPDSDQVFCIMKYLDGGQGSAGILLQRADIPGTRLLGANGAILYPYSPAYYEPFGGSDAGDGMIVVFSLGTFGNEHLRAVKAAYDGSLLWPGDVAMSSVNSNKSKTSVTSFRGGQAVAVWEDDRNGGGVYAQNILGNGTLGIPTGLAPRATRMAAAVVFPNPAHAILHVIHPLHDVLRVEIFDAAGRCVRKARMTSPASPQAGQLSVPVSELAPGMYTLVVVSKDGLARSTFIR